MDCASLLANFTSTAPSVGVASHLFTTLISTLVTSYCAIQPEWPEDHGPIAVKEGLDVYDFIVIGSGSSGAVVASRLSEIAHWKILLLEAGGVPPIEEEIPGFQWTLFGTEFDWQFKSQSETACLAYPTGCTRPRAKMLGGSSAINSMQYIRGHKHDFDHWSALGNRGWDYDSVLKYFNKFENNQANPFLQYENGRYHGDSGPLKVDFFDKTHKPFEDVYLEAMSEIGIPTIDDVNADQVIGAAHGQGNVWNGRRQSTAKGYLIPARNRTNLHIIYNAEVKKILIDDFNYATGVEFVYKGDHKICARAKKEVILSAGSLMSPKVLMLSGIGPKDDLRALGIPLKADLPVGKNLIDHIIIRLFVAFAPQNITSSPIPPIDDFYKLLMHNGGSLVTKPLSTQMTGFMNSLNRTDYTDFQLHFNYFPVDSDFTSSGYTIYNDEMREFLNKKSKTSDIGYVEVNLIQPKSRGFVTLNPANIDGDPTIRPLMLTEEDDIQAVIRAIKKILTLLDTNAFKSRDAALLKIPLAACDLYEYMSDEYWRCYAHQIGYPPSHTVGSSKMGPDSDPESVVDYRLRVRQVRRLRQIDGGIMPTVVSGNTHAACVMIGEKGADLIKNDYIINRITFNYTKGNQE